MKGEKNILAEFWLMQSYIGNVKCDICHVTHTDKWHVNMMYYRDILKSVYFNHPVLNLYSKSPRHHLLDGQKKIDNGQVCLETNSTHVASTRAVLEVGGGRINGHWWNQISQKLPPKLGHISGGLAFSEFFRLKFSCLPWSNCILKRQ